MTTTLFGSEHPSLFDEPAPLDPDEILGHREVLALVYEYMDRLVPGWRFRWDNASRRLGQCRHNDKVISISRPLTASIKRRVITETITHEIAHALTPGHGHDAVWAAKDRELGGNGRRLYDASEVTAPLPPFEGTCPGCGRVARRHRRANVSCGPCSGGRYSTAFALVWKRVG